MLYEMHLVLCIAKYLILIFTENNIQVYYICNIVQFQWLLLVCVCVFIGMKGGALVSVL